MTNFYAEEYSSGWLLDPTTLDSNFKMVKVKLSNVSKVLQKYSNLQQSPKMPSYKTDQFYFNFFQKLILLSNIDHTRYESTIITVRKKADRSSKNQHFFVTDHNWLRIELLKKSKFRLLGSCQSNWSYIYPVNRLEKKGFGLLEAANFCLNDGPEANFCLKLGLMHLICPCWSCNLWRSITRPYQIYSKYKISIIGHEYVQINQENFRRKADLACFILLESFYQQSNLKQCVETNPNRYWTKNFVINREANLMTRKNVYSPPNLPLHISEVKNVTNFLVDGNFRKGADGYDSKGWKTTIFKTVNGDTSSLSSSGLVYRHDSHYLSTGRSLDYDDSTNSSYSESDQDLYSDKSSSKPDNTPNLSVKNYLSQKILPFDSTFGQNSQEFEWIIHCVKCNLLLDGLVEVENYEEIFLALEENFKSQGRQKYADNHDCDNLVNIEEVFIHDRYNKFVF